MEWVETTVAGWDDWAPGLRTLRLERRASFRAGQFLNLALDPQGQLNRSYSMASAPDAALEFFLVEVSGGALSPQLC
ncbi:MAG: ferredoxin--NADP(+) reductase, partial [Planctomycetota bacterium]